MLTGITSHTAPNSSERRSDAAVKISGLADLLRAREEDQEAAG